MRLKLRIRNASQIVQVCRQGEQRKVGKDQMNDLAILEGTAGDYCSMVVDQDGRIKAVGRESQLQQLDWYSSASYEQDIDLGGQSAIVPGLVDGHTHPVWAGDRVHEFEWKLAGKTYMEIHQQGGGIGFTVGHTRRASESELAELLASRLQRLLRQGTTLAEAKSGYGLDWENEAKMLRVLHNARKSQPVELSITYLGAHSVPAGSTAEQATEDIINNHLPALVEMQRKGELSVDNIDVFLEKGVFDREQTRRILRAGKAAGLSLNFHGDEIHPMQSGELGAELKARAISHLEQVSADGIQQMASSGVCAVLLPTTAHILRIHPPPARQLIDSGVAVALGSDFNPNAHCLSMPYVMNLACILMHMTLQEALVASTINAAASLNKSDLHGSIEPGKWANFIVVDHCDWRHLVYEIADPPIHSVWIKGSRCA